MDARIRKAVEACISISDAAALRGENRTTLYMAADRGEIETARIGGTGTRVTTLADVDAWLARRAAGEIRPGPKAAG